jgi:pimeloyl-ACP methyl ester carboxylesterase
MSATSDAQYDSLRTRLYDQAASAGVYSPQSYPGKAVNIGQRRRQRDSSVDDPRVAVSLTESGGVLRWEQGYGVAAMGGRRGFRAGPTLQGRIIAPVNFERLKENEVGAFLESMDRSLTPFCDPRRPEAGLRELKEGAWSPKPAKPLANGRILIFIHGTFSNIGNFLPELNANPNGAEFQRRIQSAYQQILGFDHATLSVSPMLNALDLGRLFQDSKADIDVICHSRGGLVTRWWLEQFDHRARGSSRAILVGSPLDGTSLAAPDKLKAGLDFLTNVSHALETTAGMFSGGIPFLTVVTGLLRVIGSVTALGAKTPILDAALAMIPGLAAQSQMQNNTELLRLNQTGAEKPQYFGSRASFETDKPGWRFWQYFVNPGDRIREAGASLVFQGENDLVVDTASMAVLARTPQEVLIPANRILDFGRTDAVYHTVYFRQPQMTDFILKSFAIK